MYKIYVLLLSIVTIATTAPLVNTNENKVLSNSASKPIESTTTTSTTTTTSASTSKERNWLLTKAWLIDNINRLRHEFNELERDYSQHIENDNTLNLKKDKQLVEEMATLRADHTVLSQQQKQIIQLIKKSQIKSITSQPTKQQWTETNGSDNSVVLKRHKKRQIHSNFNDFVKKEQTFEDQTKRNMSEVFAEMSALHDITINIFEDLMDIEKKVNQKLG